MGGAVHGLGLRVRVCACVRVCVDWEVSFHPADLVGRCARWVFEAGVAGLGRVSVTGSGCDG